VIKLVELDYRDGGVLFAGEARGRRRRGGFATLQGDRLLWRQSPVLLRIRELVRPRPQSPDGYARPLLPAQSWWWYQCSRSLSPLQTLSLVFWSASPSSCPLTLSAIRSPTGHIHTGAQWEAARPGLQPLLVNVDAAVAGADKQCGCLGCAQPELESAKKELTDKGWLGKVNAVLGQHGLVADLSAYWINNGQSSRQVSSHAEPLLRVF